MAERRIKMPFMNILKKVVMAAARIGCCSRQWCGLSWGVGWVSVGARWLFVAAGVAVCCGWGGCLWRLGWLFVAVGVLFVEARWLFVAAG
ncbi:hypothetical protein, partial [Bartonella tribocorum]|uniref:hypothetical protein n=2 Tax=Bartonella TaxID=773 RepID=UPI00236174EF